MSSADLFVKIELLPENSRKEVSNFVDFLLKRKDLSNKGGTVMEKKKPIAGLLKGKIWIADDFDKPLDDSTFGVNPMTVS